MIDADLRDKRSPIPESAWKQLDGYTGRPVVLGTRPEDVSVIPDSASCAGVEVVEPMGAETYLYLNTGAHTFIARVPPHQRPAIDQRLGVAFDMRKSHFFDGATELTIVSISSG